MKKSENFPATAAQRSCATMAGCKGFPSLPHAGSLKAPVAAPRSRPSWRRFCLRARRLPTPSGEHPYSAAPPGRALPRNLRRACALGDRRDAWPAPPAGLFVVEERALYLRSRSPMTVAHEFGHALDCALGGGVYRSGIDPQVRSLFANATAFVTPYAATGVNEYFAESLRAYVEANDSGSPWPRATRARLRHIDPGMHDYVEMLFEIEFGERPNLVKSSRYRNLQA